MPDPDPPAPNVGTAREVRLYGAIPCGWYQHRAERMYLSGRACVVTHTALGLPLCPPQPSRPASSRG